MRSHHSPITARECAIVAALLAPLVIVAAAVAYIPLDAYGNLDPHAFVVRSMQIANDWTSVTSMKDPPLRYAPLVLVYTFVEPSGRIASAIASAYGALSVYVVAPLTMWLFARRLAGMRVAIMVVLGLLANMLVAPTLYWMRPLAAWQYYVVLPWIFAALLSTQWTLDADSQRSRYYRAAITGGLLGVAGLTQVLFSAVAVLVVFLAYLYRHRLSALLVTGLTGLPFASYYLLSTAAREQLLGGTANRSAAEPLMPITFSEIAFLVLVIAGIACLIRSRDEISPVIASGLVVSGVLWAGAVFLSGGYLSYFLPVIAVPLLLTGLATVAVELLDEHSTQISPHFVRADGGSVAESDRNSWRSMTIVLVAVSMTLTIALLTILLPTYPFWNMG